MNLSELAQRIHTLRVERRLTLEDVASQTGLTRSWLSKVENFRVTPSLPALGKIAVALGVPIADLVAGLDEKPSLVIVRKDERREVERNRSATNTTVYESLAHKRPNRVMDPFLLTIPPGVARQRALAHEGEEFLLVQSGPVDFEYVDETYSLQTGDCLYFDANAPHRLINSYEETARVLCVFSVRNAET
ncbi:helix-turn-helix domain-containing protein [Thalassoroseus pseudoceratinae]|uniref:helix-turn-helix domain-containing protein n=1 Tax=Thalassoroseus pseudoceratinae TaxID=2713176 RepID=UPI00141EDC8A|nr:cupin domain-containing protein [Thalassoroseus pseudoceratinae]